MDEWPSDDDLRSTTAPVGSPMMYSSLNVVELSSRASRRAAGRIRNLEVALESGLTKLSADMSPGEGRGVTLGFATPAAGRTKSVFSHTPSTDEVVKTAATSGVGSRNGSWPSTMRTQKFVSRLQHRTPLSSSSSAKQLRCSTLSCSPSATSLTSSSSWSTLKSRPASAAFERGESAAPGSKTLSRLVSLPEYVKRDVKKLFDSFALQQCKQQEEAQREQDRKIRQPKHAQPASEWTLQGATQPKQPQPQPEKQHLPDQTGHQKSPHSQQIAAAGAPAKRSQPPSAEVARLLPTRQSFAQLLRVYNRRASSAEIAAMLQVVAEPLGRLTSQVWAVETKRLRGSEIRRVFAAVDRDGSGGIDVSEFAAAVEEAGLDDLELRRLFDAADKDGNGGVLVCR